MAISDTITSMYENVGNVYDVLELAGADLTNVDKNIQNLKQSWEERLLYFLANGTDVVWNNWLPKVTGSGETITLNNTIEAKMDFVYKGNTYQYSTSGKNLINDYDLINRYNIASVSDNIITTNALNSNYTVFQPRTKTQKIDLVENTKYYVSFDCRLKSGTYSAKLGASIINGIDGTSYSTGNTAISNPNMSSSYQRYSFECISNITTNSILGFSIQVQQGLSNAVFEIKNIMISTSSDTTYEEYTGGPSPNPDYPQDIQVVSGDNSIKVEGKNLFNLTNQTTTINGVAISVKGSEITLNGTCNGWGAFNQNLSIKLNSNESYYLSVKNFTNNAPVNFTTPEGILYNNVGLINNKSKITRFQIQVTQGQTYNNLTYQIQLEKSSTATTYEEYKGQSYPINLGNIELCKIGTYQDKIAKSKGKNLFDDTLELGSLDGVGRNVSSDVDLRNVNYISVKPNTQYTIEIPYNTKIASRFYNSSKTYVSSGTTTNKTYTFTTPNDCYYARFSFLDQTNTSLPVQLNEGSTALPYEPYGKVWYLNKQIGKVVLNGSEAWAKGISRPFYTLVKSDVMKLSSSSSNATLICNYLQASRPDAIWNSNINGITNLDDGNAIRIRIKDNPYDITTFKQWLGTTKPIVYYVLSTPTITEITDTTLISQLEAIKKSYNNQTSISQVNNDLPFELDVVALGN